MAKLHTPLCDALGIDYPILSVGFGVAAVPELVAAVSNAGGFGVLGASGMEPDEIARRVASTRQLTSKPFGLNFIIDEVGWATSEEDRAFSRGSVAAGIAQRVTAAATSSKRRSGPAKSCSVVNDIKPAGDIVRNLVRDAEAALRE